MYKKKISLMVAASSPSDSVEMIELAKTLSRDGYEVNFVYFGDVRHQKYSLESKFDVSDTSYSKPNMIIFDTDPRINYGHLIDQKEIITINKFDAIIIILDRYIANIQFLRGVKKNKSIIILIFNLLVRLIRVIENIYRKFRLVLGKLMKPLFLLLKILYMPLKYFYYFRKCCELINIFSPNIIFIPEDVVGHVWPVLIKAANKRSVNTFILPFTMANQQEAVESLKNSYQHQSKNNGFLINFFPKWRWRNGGVDIVRMPISHIIAHSMLGISPPDPWMMNSGFSSALLVDSESTLNYFKTSGISKDKILVLGSPVQDLLRDILNKKQDYLSNLKNDLGLIKDKPLFLISGCPNQLSAGVLNCEFATMKEIADHLGKCTLQLQKHFNIVVSPHPNYPEFGEMLNPWGIVTAKLPTSNLIPLADLFLAFASSTIRWSIACSVPTINYDIFNYAYSEFSTTPGVVTINDGLKFSELMVDIAGGRNRILSLKNEIEIDSSSWGLMDGCFIDRVNILINNTIHSSTN